MALQTHGTPRKPNMKPSTIITRLLFNKLNRSVARDENARAREAKHAAEQAVHDEARANFLNWCEQVGDEHPLVAQTIAELTKVNESLTLTQATKAKRYNAIFTNAWSRAEAEYGATVASTAPVAANRLLSTIKPLVVTAGIIVTLGVIGGMLPANTTVPTSTPTQPTPGPEIRKALPVTKATPEPEVRRAIPVTQEDKQAQKDLARIHALADKSNVSEAGFSAPLSDPEDASEIEGADSTQEDDELRYTISSTGKRHNSNCRYYGKGRSVSDRKRGVACKICGG